MHAFLCILYTHVLVAYECWPSFCLFDNWMLDSLYCLKCNSELIFLSYSTMITLWQYVTGTSYKYEPIKEETILKDKKRTGVFNFFLFKTFKTFYKTETQRDSKGQRETETDRLTEMQRRHRERESGQTDSLSNSWFVQSENFSNYQQQSKDAHLHNHR